MNNVSSEYAKALFTICTEQDKIDEYADCLEQINNVISQQPEYLEYLFSPAEPLSNRLNAIDEAFSSVPTHILCFLKLLCENGRIRELPSLIEDFFELKKIHENSITAFVTSAIELSGDQKQRLEEKLRTTYNKNIVSIYNIEPSLLGGMKIEIDGKTLDGSVFKKLSLIKGAMNG